LVILFPRGISEILKSEPERVHTPDIPLDAEFHT